MKRTTPTIIIIFLLLAAWTNYDNYTRMYAADMTVYELDRSADLVIFEDATGNLWEMTGVEDWMEGDTAAVIMDNKDSMNIYDDEIIKATYTGYIY